MGTHQAKRPMLEAEISAFVDDVIATGCDICAIGHDGYVIGDSDLSDEEYEIAGPKLARIKERYGDRDHLLREIAIYLRSLGRHHDLGSPPVYWTDNSKRHEES
ncbi:hypothetical protein [Rhizobium sp. 007]|uniref:hypothetical protein n=1 Tax=Rhizobium sp. 007 TaxID=2785056 RepID=UPI001FEF3CD4|nr:hypothetical protein [Rhizobium sp. 007]